MRVLLSPQAEAYVKAEILYLRARNRTAARRFADSLRLLKSELACFPQMGQRQTDLPLCTIYRFVMGTYIVEYEWHDHAIHILRIRHGRQEAQPLPLDPDQDYED